MYPFPNSLDSLEGLLVCSCNKGIEWVKQKSGDPIHKHMEAFIWLCSVHGYLRFDRNTWQLPYFGVL